MVNSFALVVVVVVVVAVAGRRRQVVVLVVVAAVGRFGAAWPRSFWPLGRRRNACSVVCCSLARDSSSYSRNSAARKHTHTHNTRIYV